MAISNYLQELINQKSLLAQNLETKGVEASSTEKFNTLIAKVLNIESGSGSGSAEAPTVMKWADVYFIMNKINDGELILDETITDKYVIIGKILGIESTRTSNDKHYASFYLGGIEASSLPSGFTAADWSENGIVLVNDMEININGNSFESLEASSDYFNRFIVIECIPHYYTNNQYKPILELSSPVGKYMWGEVKPLPEWVANGYNIDGVNGNNIGILNISLTENGEPAQLEKNEEHYSSISLKCNVPNDNTVTLNNALTNVVPGQSDGYRYFRYSYSNYNREAQIDENTGEPEIDPNTGEIVYGEWTEGDSSNNNIGLIYQRDAEGNFYIGDYLLVLPDPSPTLVSLLNSSNSYSLEVDSSVRYSELPSFEIRYSVYYVNYYDPTSIEEVDSSSFNLVVPSDTNKTLYQLLYTTPEDRLSYSNGNFYISNDSVGILQIKYTDSETGEETIETLTTAIAQDINVADMISGDIEAEYPGFLLGHFESLGTKSEYTFGCLTREINDESPDEYVDVDYVEFTYTAPDCSDLDEILIDAGFTYDSVNDNYTYDGGILAIRTYEWDEDNQTDVINDTPLTQADAQGYTRPDDAGELELLYDNRTNE